MTTAQEQHQRARELREEGLTLRAIGERLGASPTTIHRWVNPQYARRQNEASRKYKVSLRGTCRECGGITKYSAKRGRPVSDICAPCYHRLRYENRKWTRATIIQEIKHYSARYGGPPAASDWTGANKRRDGHRYPPLQSVQREFGSWAAAIEAAGFRRPRPGYYPRNHK